MAIKDKRFSTLGGLGNDASNFSATTTGAGITLELVPDPVGTGNVAKFGLSVGDTRSELSGHVDRDPTFGTDYWLWWSIFVPDTWAKSEDPVVVIQVHEQADTSPADFVGYPQFAADITGDSFNVVNAFDVDAQTVANSDITVRTLVTYPLAKMVGRWVPLVLRVTWSYASGGALSFWIDDRKVFVDAATNNAFNNAVARGGNDPFHKFGMYGINGAVAIPNYVLHKGIVRGTSYSTYNEFMTAAGIDATEKELVFAGAAGVAS